MSISAFITTRSRQHPGIALAALSLGFFMVLLDSTILNVALPSIGRMLHGSLESLQWTVNSYTLIFASLLLTGGALGDRYGARKIFCLGLMLFVGASVLCGMAPTIELLIAMRAVQGIGAALLVPTSLSLIPHLFPEAQDRTKAVTVWAGISSLAVASGPFLGGVLVDTFGWSSVFLVNLPFGLFALLLTFSSIPAIAPQKERSLDLPGQLCAVVACCVLTYSLIEWNNFGLALKLAAFLVILVAAALFLLVERRSAQPMLPLDLFRNWKVSATMLIGLLFQFTFYGFLFVFALFFQDAYHYSAFQTGLAFLPQTAVGSFMLLFVTKWVMRKLRPGVVLSIAMLLGIAGMLLIFFGTSTSFLVIACGEVLLGLYGGLTASPIAAVVLASVAKEQAGIASASLNAARQIGGILGVALLGGALHNTSVLAGTRVALLILASACLLGLILSISSSRRTSSV